MPENALVGVWTDNTRFKIFIREKLANSGHTIRGAEEKKMPDLYIMDELYRYKGLAILAQIKGYPVIVASQAIGFEAGELIQIISELKKPEI